MDSPDLAVQVFLALRDRFFDKNGKPVPFSLREKRNTQDDPLDEYLHRVLTEELPDVTCLKAPGPLVTPDLVFLRADACKKSTRQHLRTNLGNIVAIEVKKLERTQQGAIARRSGMDYNTTPPCGTVRIYDSANQPIDIRCFYLFVCQEPVPDKVRGYTLTALALCDGNLLNENFDYYLSIVGERAKEIGLGTYGNGANRNRPMLIFANPLGAHELDQRVTLVHSDKNVAMRNSSLNLTNILQRSVTSGGWREFYCYRFRKDVPAEWQTTTLRDPFPTPERVEATQPRGKFRLNFKPLD